MLNKSKIKNEIVESLKDEKEIVKIIIFGSFIKLNNPNDLDLAVIQDSGENYLTLSLKYRKLLRNVARQIPVDLFPIVNNNNNNFYQNEILSGDVIYAR